MLAAVSTLAFSCRGRVKEPYESDTDRKVAMSQDKRACLENCESVP